jgi:hypothetical protein
MTIKTKRGEHPIMVCKLNLNNVVRHPGQEKLDFTAVAKSGSYGEDGHDDDNTYAKFSPSAHFEITVANPALFAKLDPGKKYYFVCYEAVPDEEPAPTPSE